MTNTIACIFTQLTSLPAQLRCLSVCNLSKNNSNCSTARHWKKQHPCICFFKFYDQFQMKNCLYKLLRLLLKDHNFNQVGRITVAVVCRQPFLHVKYLTIWHEQFACHECLIISEKLVWQVQPLFEKNSSNCYERRIPLHGAYKARKDYIISYKFDTILNLHDLQCSVFGMNMTPSLILTLHKTKLAVIIRKKPVFAFLPP